MSAEATIALFNKLSVIGTSLDETGAATSGQAIGHEEHTTWPSILAMATRYPSASKTCKLLADRKSSR